MKKIIFHLLLIAAGAALLSGCPSGTDSGEAENEVTATVTAGTGLTAFAYHNSTAYRANFGDAGITISGETSATRSGGAVASYSWEQISGPAVTITSPDTTSATLAFTAPAMTSILHASDQYKWQVLPISRDDALAVFRLTVTDAAGASGVTTFTVYLHDAGSFLRFTSGLRNVGVGEKTYLSGPSLKANASSASTGVTDWTWALAAPQGSASALSATNTQIVNFTPDMAGTYTITYQSTSAGVSATTMTINASTYVGVGSVGGTTPSAGAGQCGACHDGRGGLSNNLGEWEATGHSSMFEQVISYYKNYAPSPYCWECHTTGYDSDTSADNGGFDDLVRQADYSFPSEGTTWENFVSDNATIAPLADIQCENCHGPGGAHFGTITDSKIYVSNSNHGMCGRCHPQDAEWKSAAHNSTGIKNNAGRYRLTSWRNAGCARCHTTGGFIQKAAGEEVTAQTDVDDIGVGCVACHDPHSVAADSPSGSTSISGNDSTQLRLKGVVTMMDDASTQVDAGKAAVCYTCHDGYYVKGETDCDSDGDGTLDAACETVDQVATQYFRQIHHNSQAFVLEGLGAVTHFSDSAYDFTLTENSFHSSRYFTLAFGSGDSSKSSENNKCVTCHMGEEAPEATEEGYRQVGGHTWWLESGSVEFLDSCRVCHAGLSSLNRTARADYDGDGAVEGIQDEISGILLALSDKIKAIDPTNVTGGETVADGAITVASLSYSNQTKMNASPIDVRRAVYNHNLIANDGSKGSHNTAFSVQVLQKTYTAISGLNGGNSFKTDFPNAVLR